MPVRQSRRRSQRVPTSLLDAPANTATFKTCHDRLSTESRYEQDEHGDIKNVPSKNNPAAKTMAVKRTRIHLETESRVARSKGKARVLLAESENEGEIPYVSFSLITRTTSIVLSPFSDFLFNPVHTASAAMSTTQVALISIRSDDHLARTVVPIINRVVLLLLLAM